MIALIQIPALLLSHWYDSTFLTGLFKQSEINEVLEQCLAHAEGKIHAWYCYWLHWGFATSLPALPALFSAFGISADPALHLQVLPVSSTWILSSRWLESHLFRAALLVNLSLIPPASLIKISASPPSCKSTYSTFVTDVFVYVDLKNICWLAIWD